MKTEEKNNSEQMTSLAISQVQFKMSDVSGDSNIRTATFTPWTQFDPGAGSTRWLTSENTLIVKCTAQNQGSQQVTIGMEDIRMLVQAPGQSQIDDYNKIYFSRDVSTRSFLYYDENKQYVLEWFTIAPRQTVTFYVFIKYPGRIGEATSSSGNPSSGTQWKSRVHLQVWRSNFYADLDDIHLNIQQR